MDLLSTVVNAVIVGLSAAIGSYVVIRWQKNELFAYLLSQEGIQDLATIGAAIAAGAMTQLRTGNKAGGIKLGPLRIPQAFVDAALARGAEMFFGKQPVQPQA